MSLKEYKEKRNFKTTTEPKGKKKKSVTSRFVVQYHEARAKHYDFRLEYKGVLLSWAVPKGLSNSPKDKRLAVMVEDHPLDYINFEGVIPKGNYGAGTVEIFDKGEYLPLEDMARGLKKGHIKIVLNGEKLKGAWSFIKTDEKNWLAVKIEDEYSSEKKTVKKTKLPFKECSVSLATVSKRIPRGKDWIFEIKYDGYRMLAFVENGKVKILSRNGVDYTKKFNKIVSSLKEIEQENFVIDGEIVCFDDKGRSDFGLLQESIKFGTHEIYYVVFDLLALNGEDLRNRPLIERKEKLERLVFKAKPNVVYSQHVEKGDETFDFAKENNLEGIVAKNVTSIYDGKRSENWLKIKCFSRQEFVIAGFTTSDKKEIISALVLGYYDKRELKFIGKVGTGLSEETIKELHAKFQKFIKKTCPFKEVPKIKNTTWLNPVFVAEIQFSEITKDGLLRQPSFIGLRQDKKAREVVLEIEQ